MFNSTVILFHVFFINFAREIVIINVNIIRYSSVQTSILLPESSTRGRDSLGKMSGSSSDTVSACRETLPNVTALMGLFYSRWYQEIFKRLCPQGSRKVRNRLKTQNFETLT